MQIQESGEMYLETIHVLQKEIGHVRSVDVAEHMGYSKPSISRAMGILKSAEYICIDADGFITLTSTGLEIAEKIYQRHEVLTKMLISLGVDPQTAAEDACKLEHAISDVSFNAIQKHLEQNT